MSRPVLHIAIPSPLRRRFDYLAPAEAIAPGSRVRIRFGRRLLVGVVLGSSAHSEVPPDRLRPVEAVLDAEPLLPVEILELLTWASAYYHHPIGEVCAAALPAALRQGEPAQPRTLRRHALTATGRAARPDELKRAPRQAALLAHLQRLDAPAGAGELAAIEGWQGTMARLVEKGWVEVQEIPALPATGMASDTPPPLAAAQQAAVDAVSAAFGRFGGFLLDGVTGSGKTEVYLRLIAQNLAAGRQTLILVPEIGLTPQLLERFRRRFPVPIAVLHSGLADGERLNAWLAARAGLAPIVIGTRSAVFTPLPRLGLIVVDEEHDPSFKQQDGFRYSARDVAVVRAQKAGVPIVLGSATPALESLANATAGRYVRLELPERAGSAIHPRLHLLDIRHQRLDGGISEPLYGVIGRHLERGGQVLLFLNRRGYAPVLLCHDCGWVATCRRCDAHLTYHAGQQRIRCHHCGTERPVPPQCGSCGSHDLRPIGHGTERVEEALRARFPDTGIERIDRDATRRKGSLEAKLERVHSGAARLLIGTQMLAKGHHFPDVTLVGILDADQGLFSVDFRAGERMAQLILQVAGRAGRAERPGEVLIQTHHPDHPLLRLLIDQGYGAFAAAALEERRQAGLPPYAFLALLRAEAPAAAMPQAFLEQARLLAEGLQPEGVMLLGPVPAPMERRAGRYRAQLLLQTASRPALHRLLDRWLPLLEDSKEGRRVRWSLDVDPGEMF
ncbi:MAG: primosomal protein N' [Thiohalomonadaceae bacterium]